MTIKYFKVLFLTLFLVASNSCKKDKPEEDPTPAGTPKLVISDAEALPYQLIGFKLENGLPPYENAKTESIKIGDSTAVAYRTSDNNIYAYNFELPELAPGKYIIIMHTRSGDAKAEISVKPYTPITDANQYIQDYNTELNEQYTQTALEYDTKVQEGNLRRSTADSLKDFVKKAYDKNAELLSKLSDREKKKFAYMYEANKHWLNEYKNAMAQIPFIQRGKKTTDPCQQYADQWEFAYSQGWKEQMQTAMQKLNECRAKQEAARLEATKNTFSGKINAAYDKAKKEVDETGDKLNAAWAFVSSCVTEAAQELAETAKGLTSVKDPFAPLDMEEPKKEKQSSISFTDGEENYLSAGINVTNLNRQNAGISPQLEVMISSIDDFKETMTKIGQFLPYTLEADVPATRTEKIFVTDFTIDQVSNPNIKLEIIDMPKGKKVKFTANNITAPETDFTFRMNVKTAYGEVSKIIEATLHLPLDKVLISGSPWKVISMVNDGEDQFKLQARGNYFCNNEQYFDSSKIKSATMTFTANNGGSFAGTWENHNHKFSGEGSNCSHLGIEVTTVSETNPISWTFDKATNIIKIPQLVNDEVDEFKVTYSNGIISLKSIYMEIRLQKP